ncbi:hypothetical protein POM88_043813 [Heracleum sosnowskyi]|uniref:Uncharacterized protein n=1 Tax=Heracleum sosnowskyi TaxID=360622 RepID=A0AAD8H427_9APIA|nr:hypothetical protein POM88_043813 [Heracleum sosnowskyi]
MPMFDITNQSNGAEKSSLKFNKNCNRKQICEESSCNLFEEQFASKDDDNIDLQDYEIDESIIDGACFSDDGLFDSDDSYEEYCSTQSFAGYVDSYSDEEDIIEQDLSSKIPRRAQHVIPEEYASLGSPSVECKHCHARMWKEERVNKNVTKETPVFSVCCKKGDVKLPATPTPPTYLMDLYNDEVKSSSFQRNIRLKLQQLMTDIKKKAYFGNCIGVMYVVEFQKRAEIPDPLKDPVGYAAVKAFMIHGPCSLQNPKSPCMKGFKCIRHFPKKYSARTIFDESGFPLYMRRRTNITVNVRKAELDNQWVVPYNHDLLGHDMETIKISDLRHLWDSHWKHMVDDILMKRHNLMRNSTLMLNDKQLQFYALAEIDDLLRSIGKSLKNFLQLPQPPTSYMNHGSNNLILEETNYNVVEMEAQYKELLGHLTEEQLHVYEGILDSIMKKEVFR